MYLSPEKAIERWGKLDSRRSNIKSVWQQIADNMIPLKNNITDVKAGGEAKFNQILDSTAMISLEMLAGALHGMLTSPTSVFFNLSTGKPDLDNLDSVRFWIQDAVRKMHDVFNASNFQTEVHEYYIDLCGFGNGALYCEEDIRDVVRFACRPLQEICVEENFKGKIDTQYRKYKEDARSIIDEFGQGDAAKNLPDSVKQCYQSGKNDEFEILHCIYPREKAEESKFPFISQYIFVKDKKDLKVGGFKEFPLIYGRWTKISGETEGRGPGEKALPESKVLQKMMETTLRGAQKVADPPLQAPDDGFVMPLITTPAGVNFYRPGSTDRIEPIFNDSRVDFGFQAIDRIRASVREAFYVNQLQLREGPQMTAAEVNQRVEQSLRFLAPMLGRQNSEFLSPLVERVFAIMNRRQMFLPVPPELNGVELKIQYSSVMAMSQRMSEMQNINRTFAAITPLISIDPHGMDNFDVDNGIKHIAKLHNFPQEVLRTKKQVDSIRENRAKNEQAAAAAAEQETNSKTMKNVADAGSKLTLAQ